GLELRNSIERPLRYYVKTIEVLLDGRPPSGAHFDNMGAVIAARGSTVFFLPQFSMVSNDKLHDVSISYEIIYGHPEIGFSRRMSGGVKGQAAVGVRTEFSWRTTGDAADTEIKS